MSATLDVKSIVLPGQSESTPPPLEIKGMISVSTKSADIEVQDPFTTVTVYIPP